MPNTLNGTYVTLLVGAVMLLIWAWMD